jgi:hypothetical protein
LRVNAGGEAYIDSQGNYWEGDRAYVTGSWGYYGDDNPTDWGTEHAIQGTADDRIYQTERWGFEEYKFDLGDGICSVTLHFSENYDAITGPGERVFDVYIEEQLLLDDFDIFAEAGQTMALKKTFHDIYVEDGQLNIVVVSVTEMPNINGIEIFGSLIPADSEIVTPLITLSPTEGEIGSQVHVTGCGFSPSSSLRIYLGTFAMSFITTDNTGCFNTSFTIPDDSQPGETSITASEDMGESTSETFTVLQQDDDGGIPVAGSVASGILLLLLLLGTAYVAKRLLS